MVCITAVVTGQDYLWPVKLGKAITSNFAEVRPRRFHSGIDIRTDGSTGHEIVAIEAGYVWRVKVSSNGYGKVLYLKLNDGSTAVYAHLQKFMPLLNDIIKIEQDINRSYSVEKYFRENEFTIAKGEVLGTTGESGGAFGPHLHFELRDSLNRPINPLTHGFPLNDKHAPVPDAVAIIPLSKDAVINGSSLSQTFPLHRRGGSSYEFPDTIHVYGSVGFDVSVTDEITGFPNKFNIAGASLSVDDVEVYRADFESFSFERTHFVETERDNALRRLNDGEFHRLFTLDRNSNLSFIKEGSGGTLSLSPGHHTVSIRLFDHKKNISRIKGTIYHAPPFSIGTTVLTQDRKTVTISLETIGTPFPVTDFACYSFNNKGYVEEKVEALSSRQDGRALIVDLPASRVRGRILQLIGTDKLGGVSLPFHLPLGADEADPIKMAIDFDISHLEKSVVIQVDSRGWVADPPEVVLTGRNREVPIQLQRTRPTTFISTPLDPQTVAGVTEAVVLYDGSPARESHFIFKPKLFTGDRAMAVISPDGRCSLQAVPTTFYDTTAIWIENIETPVPVEGGEFRSRAYQLQPFERPLQDSARVAIALAKSIANADRMSIFYYDQKGGWTCLPSQFSRSRWMFFASLYSLEAVAVIEDRVPPVIETILPGDGGFYDYNDLMSFSAKVKDSLAGVKDDKAIQLSLDGEQLLFEYQPVKKKVIYQLDSPLESGSHTLIIKVADQVGNMTTKEIAFSVN